MSLRDRFRINELTQNGSKSISRDADGGIIVRRINKEEVPQEVKTDLVYGVDPMKGKQITPRTKEDLVKPAVQPINPEQKSFSGETSARIEKPVYNEEELKKAIDVKVDELVKPQKKPRGKFVTQQKYNQLRDSYNTVNVDLRKTRDELSTTNSQLSEAQSSVETLSSQISSIQSQNALLTQQTTQQQGEIASLNDTLSQRQIRIAELQAEAAQFKAESEAKTAQLQAQSENLKNQLEAQEAIIDNLNNQIQSLTGVFTAQLNSLQGQLSTAQEFSNQLQIQLANQQQQALLTQQQLQAQIQQTQQQANQQIEAAQNAAAAQVQTSQQQVQAAQQQAQQAQQSQKKKKKIICNELYNQGFLPQELWDADERYGDMMFEKDPRLVIGYQMWAQYVVKFMRENPQYSKYSYMIFRPWTEFMAYEMGVIKKKNLIGQLTNFVGKHFSYLVFDLNNGERLLNLYNYKKFQSDIE